MEGAPHTAKKSTLCVYGVAPSPIYKDEDPLGDDVIKVFCVSKK